MTALHFIVKDDIENNHNYSGHPTDRYYYSEGDMAIFAERYHQAKLKLLGIADVVGQSEQLKAFSDLKDFAYEVCPLHREDDLEEIVGRL
jgi:hypothetical protein